MKKKLNLLNIRTERIKNLNILLKYCKQIIVSSTNNFLIEYIILDQNIFKSGWLYFSFICFQTDIVYLFSDIDNKEFYLFSIFSQKNIFIVYYSEYSTNYIIDIVVDYYTTNIDQYNCAIFIQNSEYQSNSIWQLYLLYFDSIILI